MSSVKESEVGTKAKSRLSIITHTFLLKINFDKEVIRVAFLINSCTPGGPVGLVVGLAYTIVVNEENYVGK